MAPPLIPPSPMAPPLIPPSPIIIPSGEDSLEGDGGMLAGLPLLVLWLLVCFGVPGQLTAPPSIPHSPMAPPLIPPSLIIIPSGEDSLEGFGGMLAGLLLLICHLLVCSGVWGQSTAPPSILPSPMAPPLIPPSPIVVWSWRDSVEEHGGAFGGLILPGGLVGPLIFG